MQLFLKLIFSVVFITLIFTTCKKKKVDTVAVATVWNTYAGRPEPNVKLALKERSNSYGSYGTSGINNSETILQEAYTDDNGQYDFGNFQAKVNVKSKNDYEYVISVTELLGKTITGSSIGGTKVEKGKIQIIQIPIHIDGTLDFSITNNPPQGGGDTIQVTFKNPNDHIMYENGIVFQTSYGTGIYPTIMPMGPYNITIKKYKGGVYTETFDNIYINANQTTSYNIVF